MEKQGMSEQQTRCNSSQRAKSTTTIARLKPPFEGESVDTRQPTIKSNPCIEKPSGGDRDHCKTQSNAGKLSVLQTKAPKLNENGILFSGSECLLTQRKKANRQGRTDECTVDPMYSCPGCTTAGKQTEKKMFHDTGSAVHRKYAKHQRKSGSMNETKLSELMSGLVNYMQNSEFTIKNH